MGLDQGDAQREAARLKADLTGILYLPADSSHLDLLISSLTEYNPGFPTDEALAWLDQRAATASPRVEPVPLSGLRQWYFDPRTGDLVHTTGGFFAIRGLEVATNLGPVRRWTQPIIDQPRIGLLGMMAQRRGGILYFLMQAKAEPGNIGGYQWAPTVQATRSNYLRHHGGKPTPYLDYFLDGRAARVLYDQHQTEQGARFYRKRNRNMIIQAPDDAEIELLPHYRWLTLGQIKRLMLRDNTVNMDARSVISLISFCPGHGVPCRAVSAADLRGCLENTPLARPLDDVSFRLLLSACSPDSPRHSLDELLRRMSREKFQVELDTRLIPLREVKDWTVTPQEISHLRGLYFSVAGVRVEAPDREVSSWDQPIIRQRHPGLAGFIVKELDGALHFLVQLKLESGNIDLLGMAPTVQCITGSYDTPNLPPYVAEMLQPQRSRVVFDTLQSEEGGRFFREENRNLLLLADESFPLETPPRYLWVSLRQLKQFLEFNNFLNVEARSLLALIQ
ncbi:MAG: NDP-hexose 2,3-dehydratase [Candidatus Zixiibacteriota bacterium]|nr:MAG: NDP-hexose 2,3-dehydratase [candidate division Zixibacteria bacterium]